MEALSSPLFSCVITPETGGSMNTSSQALSNFSASPLCGHTYSLHTHMLIQSVMLKKRPLSPLFPFLLPFFLFLFRLTSSVSIRCDIPFGSLITSLSFVLWEPKNFIDDGHKPIHSPSRCRHKYKFIMLALAFHLSRKMFLPLKASFLCSLPQIPDC